MQFSFHEEAGSEELELSGEKFKHIFKVRRKSSSKPLKLRNLKDELIYTYTCLSINKNKAILELVSKEKKPLLGTDLHLAWSVIEPKTVEKTLPFLNELGVSKLSFVYTEFSQKNFKLDMQRLKRILISSCEQCGRSKMMDMEVFDSLESYLKSYPSTYVLDFGGADIKTTKRDANPILVGCEGGFSQRERELFCPERILGYESKLILKSQTAMILASSLS